MAVVVAVVDLRPPSRRLGCCSGHAWQLLAEDWVAGRFRPLVRYRYYRCHHREESLALEVPALALVHLAGLAEAVGHFQQGSGASVLCHHHDGNLVLQVRQEACGPLQVEAEGRAGRSDFLLRARTRRARLRR